MLWVINRLGTIIFKYINKFWNYKSVKLKLDSAELARRRQFTTTYMQRVANQGTRRPHLKKQRDLAASEAGLHRCRGCMLFRGCPPLAVRRAYYAYRHACRAPCQPRTVPAAWSTAALPAWPRPRWGQKRVRFCVNAVGCSERGLLASPLCLPRAAPCRAAPTHARRSLLSKAYSV